MAARGLDRSGGGKVGGVYFLPRWRRRLARGSPTLGRVDPMKVGEEVAHMRLNLRLTVQVALLACGFLLVGMFVVTVPHHATSTGPYQSALTTMGAATAAAAEIGCNNETCEFFAHQFRCVGGVSGARCKKSGGTCTDVICG